MNAREYLGKMVQVTIDRPLGSKHPTCDLIYPVNYGFVPDTQSGDGEELDAYVLTIETALRGFEGRCIGIIHRLDEDDDKLILVPDGTSLTRDEILKSVHFQEQFFRSQLIVTGP